MKSFRITLAITLAAAFLSTDVSAAKKTKIPLTKEPARNHDAVEMFKAMKDGDIEVNLIGLDSTKANVIIKNKTKKPLAIRLPEAFAGVPALAQFGGGGMGGMGGGMGGGGGGGQGMGGGMSGGMGGMGGGGGGMGGGFFNVAPERVRKLNVDVVCLDHGKKDPNPRMKYKIVPIETYTKKPEVIEVCKMLGHGRVPQNAAQAATWHMQNGLSFNELARKDKVRLRLSNYVQKWFTPQELMYAQQLVAFATKRAKDTPIKSPGEEQASIGNKLQQQ